MRLEALDAGDGLGGALLRGAHALVRVLEALAQAVGLLALLLGARGGLLALGLVRGLARLGGRARALLDLEAAARVDQLLAHRLELVLERLLLLGGRHELDAQRRLGLLALGGGRVERGLQLGGGLGGLAAAGGELRQLALELAALPLGRLERGHEARLLGRERVALLGQRRRARLGRRERRLEVGDARGGGAVRQRDRDVVGVLADGREQATGRGLAHGDHAGLIVVWGVCDGCGFVVA